MESPSTNEDRKMSSKTSFLSSVTCETSRNDEKIITGDNGRGEYNNSASAPRAKKSVPKAKTTDKQ